MAHLRVASRWVRTVLTQPEEAMDRYRTRQLAHNGHGGPTSEEAFAGHLRGRHQYKGGAFGVAWGERSDAIAR